jgi:type II secretory pathway pseudopilin PulG
MRITRKIFGFSMLEMAIAMVIISAAFGSVVAILPTKRAEDNNILTTNKMDKIEKALLAFYNQHGYLPCPASRADAVSSPNFGVSTNCTQSSVAGTTDITPTTKSIRFGVVPVRSLNLSDEYMFDAWGMRFSYAIIKSLGVDEATFITSNASPNDPFILRDQNSLQINGANAEIYISALLLSHGQNRKGAHSSNGNIDVACAGTGLDVENCDLDNIFITSPHNSSSATYYDDFIRWFTNLNIITKSGGHTPSECTPNEQNFSPNDAFGLVFWLDAADVSTLVQTPEVQSWTDKSQYAFFLQPAGLNPPIYQSSGFNGKPTVSIVNKNGFQITGAQLQYLSISSNFTFFFVGKQNEVSGANYLFDMGADATRFGINLNMSGNNFWYRQYNTLHTSQTYSNNVYATWVFKDGGNPEAALYLNGNLATSNSLFNPLIPDQTCIKIGESCTAGARL